MTLMFDVNRTELPLVRITSDSRQLSVRRVHDPERLREAPGTMAGLIATASPISVSSRTPGARWDLSLRCPMCRTLLEHFNDALNMR
jgi:hypothetical protein